MKSDVIEIATGADPGATVCVLHGLGASADDFVPFVEQLDLRALGAVRFLFPQAPTRAITVNGGFQMPAWYDIANSDLGRMEDEEGLRSSQRSIENLLAREQARGMPSHRIVLGGFSQGCAMALMTGLRHRARLGGLIGMSGYLPLKATTATEREQVNEDLPIFLAHGTRDAVVPLRRAEDSRDALLAMGQPVEWHTYAMEHTVCALEVADINRWLIQTLRG